MIKIPRNNILSKLWWYFKNFKYYQKDSIIDDKINYWIDNNLLELTDNYQWFNVTDGSEVQLDRDGYGIRKLHDSSTCYPNLTPFTRMRLIQYRRRCIELSDDAWQVENGNRAKELLKIFDKVDI